MGIPKSHSTAARPISSPPQKEPAITTPHGVAGSLWNTTFCCSPIELTFGFILRDAVAFPVAIDVPPWTGARNAAGVMRLRAPGARFPLHHAGPLPK